MPKLFMLASDYDESKLRFPLYAQPKIDGVRAGWLNSFTGRSLKPFRNRYTQARFADPKYQGLDGEMTANEPCNSPTLCRATTSALNSILGEPRHIWYVFDYVTECSAKLAYVERRNLLGAKVNMLADPAVTMVPAFLCHTIADLLALDDEFLDRGYEGTIVRDPNGTYKEGRSTIREGGLLRIKRFIEEEAEVLELVEGESNNNEAQTDERGYTFRTSHQENKVANGLLGSMWCRLLKDVVYRGEKLFDAGQVIKVSAGKMPHTQREYYMQHPEHLLGQVIKFKTFPKGIKDKPRFPTFSSIRMAEDMGGVE